MKLKKGITVYCASSTHISQLYFDAAHILGAGIAAAGVPVINGGGKMGLMAAVTDGALEAGGTAIGVIPQFMVEAGRNHSALTHTIVTPTMHARKKCMADLALGVIALPGGVGTFEELTEMMTWRKLGLFNGKVVILNVNGYYDPLLALLVQSEEQGFSEGERVWTVASTPLQAIEIIMADASQRGQLDTCADVMATAQ